MNSSPPTLPIKSFSRKVLLNCRAICIMTSSPAKCPSVSFTFLNRSISIIINTPILSDVAVAIAVLTDSSVVDLFRSPVMESTRDLSNNCNCSFFCLSMSRIMPKALTGSPFSPFICMQYRENHLYSLLTVSTRDWLVSPDEESMSMNWLRNTFVRLSMNSLPESLSRKRSITGLLPKTVLYLSANQTVSVAKSYSKLMSSDRPVRISSFCFSNAISCFNSRISV